MLYSEILQRYPLSAKIDTVLEDLRKPKLWPKALPAIPSRKCCRSAANTEEIELRKDLL